jgi:D-alanine-D-alanine ligase
MKKTIAVILGDPRLPDPVKKDGKFNPEDIKTVQVLKKALESLNDYNFTYLDNHSTLLSDLNALNNGSSVDYVINFCDEGFYNNPLREKEIPELLEKHGLFYTGSNPRCLKLCYDKYAIKKIAKENQIPVAKGFVLRKDSYIPREIKFPMFVKPNYGDGSFGINDRSIVNNPDELYTQVQWVREILKQTSHKPHVLIEEFLPGEELSVAIIGNHPELNYSIIQETLDVLTEGPKIISYDAKWNPESEAWNKLSSIKPRIKKTLQNEIKSHSLNLYNILKIRDYARFDWRLDKEGNPRLLEVNPNCGWCYDGHLVKAFSLDNNQSLEENYPKVLEKILKAAEKRMKN